MASITAMDRSAGFPERRVSQAGLSLLRHWLEQIVLTLPEPRQRMYDLFVARDLDTPSAAVELGTSVAEVRRLRRENRQAVLRAFEVTALAAAESAPDRPWNAASGCRELKQILTAGQHDGDLREAGEHRFVVLSAALRVTVSRHLSQCTACQRRRDDCMASWAPELLAILGGAGPSEPVAPHGRPMPVRHGSASGPPRRVSSAGTARTVTVRLATATGAGLLAALPLLAFVWPGFAHEHHSSAGPSSLALSGQSSIITPQAAGTAGGVAVDGRGGRSASGLPSTPAPQPSVSMPAPLFTPLPPPVYYTLPPSASPTPSLSQQTSPTSVPSPTPSWIPSSPKPRLTSPAPHPSTTTAPSSHTPAPTPTSTASAAPSPTPSDTPSPSDTATPSSPAPSSPDPTASDSATSAAPESSAPTPEPSPTPADSASS